MCYVKFKETNQICSPLKISQSIDAERACDKNNKAWIVAFMKTRNPLIVWCIEGKKTEDSENMAYFFKAYAKNFLLTLKSCSWLNFYQMDFMKK